MLVSRALSLSLATIVVAGCSTLGVGGNKAGVKIIGKQTYCGTASQSSELHYFASQAEFDNWVDYRDLDGWHERVTGSGLLIVEMGQRPTGGYKLKLDNKVTKIEGDTLDIGFDWDAPRSDAAVSQAMTSQCVAVKLPKGSFSRVNVLDQIGNSRGTFTVKR